uniref:Uncharacterized protein n=1 Tax=viral metagenome TaxID=1070528 RepID=A0A6M3Y1G8_9ZZZZ
MELKNVYNGDKHFVIDLKKSELEVILKNIRHNIERENREVSEVEASIMRDIKDILEEDN